MNNITTCGAGSNIRIGLWRHLSMESFDDGSSFALADVQSQLNVSIKNGTSDYHGLIRAGSH